VTEGINLSGKVTIVTGASSGLGVESARVLALRGAHVVVAVRDVKKGEETVQNLVSQSEGKLNSNQFEVSALDLGSFQSVKDFASRFLASGRPLNILLNNAGIMATPTLQLVEGYESQFATNHLGHFLLTVLLAPALVKGAPSRVVSVSSVAHKRSNVHLDDINFSNRPYEKWSSYGQSKTANILFAIELNKRLASKGVQAFSLHPGGIMTGLQVNVSKDEMRAMGWIDENGNLNSRFKTIPQGAATSLYAATSPDLDGKGGVYLEDNQISHIDPKDPKVFGGWSDHAKDEQAAARLWEISEKATGVSLTV